MSTTITMPAEVALLAREALYWELTRACENMPSGLPESHTRAGWAPLLRRLQAVAEALGILGWVDTHTQQPVRIELTDTLVEVLEADAEQWRWAAEQDRLESAEGRARAAAHAQRIERFLASLPTSPAPTTLLIPVSAFAIIRERLHGCVTDVSSAIDTSGNLRQCSRDLNEICDLLDLIGWTSAEQPEIDIDASEHAAALAKATQKMLPVLAQAASDHADRDPEKEETEDQLELTRDLHTAACRATGEPSS